MVRLTGGTLRGRLVKVPRGLATRPTAARVREAIFNILRDRITGARACDLFAGSGLLGLEALSRGAASCVFVERRAAAAKIIRENLQQLGLEGKGRVIVGNAVAVLSRLTEQGPFDIVFADPPYEKGYVKTVVSLFARYELLAPTGVLVIEHGPGEVPEVEEGIALVESRRYGQTQVSFLKKEI